MTLKSSRNLLTLIWLLGFLPAFLILSAQTYFGTYYGDNDKEAWSWFTPNIVPTLGLIIGTLASGAVGEHEDRAVDPFFFRLTLALSILYLTIFNLIFILEPLSDSPPLETFRRSSLFLGVAQGLVTIALGAFFVRTAKTSK